MASPDFNVNLQEEPPSPAPSEKRPPRRAAVYTGFGGFLLFMLFVTVFFYYNFKTIEVKGESMEPTLHDGNRLLISSAYWLVGPIVKDDIVVIKNEIEGDVIIKRVYGIEGQEIDPLNVPETYDLGSGPYVVPKGTIYVLGDNIGVSEDSRHYGPFDIKSVIGKVVAVHSVFSGKNEPSSE